ncbi:MAG: DUF3048 domain-containing protein [Acidimicrobiales bacterium]
MEPGSGSPAPGGTPAHPTWLTRGRLVAPVALAVALIVVAVVVTRWLTSTDGGPGNAPGDVEAGTEPLTGQVSPLTGLADPSGDTATRCAVTVKVGNTVEAQPHWGLEQADVVYEEVVEGGITRLLAVYQSQAPDRVGSVRSVRQTDHSVVWPLRGVFVFSGGNQDELASIADAPVTRIDETRAGDMMFRDPTRTAPHNLYADVGQMYSRCTDPPPPALFTYRPAGVPPGGDPVSSVHVGFTNGYDVTWTWDGSSGAWDRSLFGAPEVSGSGTRLSATNVVVMFASYAGGVAIEGSEATLTGQGKVSVFTGGKVVEGTWSRPDLTQPAQLLDRDHHPIPLTPGTTWVELPDVSYVVTTTP